METITKNELNSKILELGKEICKVKGFKIEDNNIEDIAEKIYYYSIWFNNYYEMIKFNYEDEKIVLDLYNSLTNEVKLYKKMKRKIEEEGFEKLEKLYKKKLKELFIQMLDYKKRKYNKDTTLIELLKEIDLCYHDFKYTWTSLYQMLTSTREHPHMDKALNNQRQNG